MTPIDTAELERLAASITPGEWRVEAGTTLVWGSCDADDTSDRGMGYPVSECRIAPISSWAKGPDANEGEANARAIALVPALICEVLARRKAEAGMRALLLAGCDLLAFEASALRASISVNGVMCPDPEDQATVESIREIEDWIASVKATLYPTTPEAEGGCDAE
ncbi:hypothetical protein [Paracoccus denitrificans]|nr:hypothetical protein [Paracoccus denitrificans]MBB4628099.1 hypothetical protein [Paracoccus denitrificans]MCU7429164.1 hypothetical protein [Paracoccus denitrificans]QAR28388.1 hypothetical protein EO213_18975 [Paracoccus denitrificans]UPV96524.1 hypothetical protein M0K93_19065 [Paracoccus denitrificans]WQO36049.1 hypothetical protein U0005_16355 [Paracoccus denitrificans]